MSQIHFKMTLEEANLVFKGLGYLPFKDVYELIGNLNEQANAQLQKNQSFPDNLEEWQENKNIKKS
jgi:hypothetical protein